MLLFLLLPSCLPGFAEIIIISCMRHLPHLYILVQFCLAGLLPQVEKLGAVSREKKLHR